VHPHQPAADGLDNKERWHWKERDLREWVNAWLMRAFVQFDGGEVFGDEEALSVLADARVDVSEAEIITEIGHGSFGRVCSAVWRGRVVALKEFRRVRINPEQLRLARRALILECSLPPHPNVVRLLGVSWDTASASLVQVMELCNCGSLAGMLGNARAHKDEVLQISRGVAAGLAHLHTQEPHVIHRDLKPENVMLHRPSGARGGGARDGGEDGEVLAKIADLGSSREQAEVTMSGSVGTMLFSAPELLVVLGSRYDAAVDMWALGCVLSCLCTGSCSPYPAGAPLHLQLERVRDGELKPAVPGGHPLARLVDQCCALRPSERPSADEVVRQLQSLSGGGAGGRKAGA